MTRQMEHEWGGIQRMGDFKDIFFIPIPMAMFGMCVAFMFGATVGLLVGKKRRLSEYGGKDWMHHKGWGHVGMGWKGWEGAGHHHHGFGAPPCFEPHEAWPTSEHAPEETPDEE